MLTDIGDISGNFFRTQLGITRNTGQFNDVYRGEAVFFNDPLRNQDRILEVVTIPWHKCDQHVLTQRQFTKVCRRTIGQHVTLGDYITNNDQWTLIHTGVLV